MVANLKYLAKMLIFMLALEPDFKIMHMYAYTKNMFLFGIDYAAVSDWLKKARREKLQKAHEQGVILSHNSMNPIVYILVLVLKYIGLLFLLHYLSLNICKRNVSHG